MECKEQYSRKESRESRNRRQVREVRRNGVNLPCCRVSEYQTEVLRTATVMRISELCGLHWAGIVSAMEKEEDTDTEGQ